MTKTFLKQYFRYFILILMLGLITMHNDYAYAISDAQALSLYDSFDGDKPKRSDVVSFLSAHSNVYVIISGGYPWDRPPKREIGFVACNFSDVEIKMGSPRTIELKNFDAILDSNINMGIEINPNNHEFYAWNATENSIWGDGFQGETELPRGEVMEVLNQGKEKILAIILKVVLIAVCSIGLLIVLISLVKLFLRLCKGLSSQL